MTTTLVATRRVVLPDDHPDGAAEADAPSGGRRGRESVDVEAPSRPALEPELVGRRELAGLLMVSESTIDRLHSAGNLPRALTVSRGALRWRIATIRAWLAASERAGRLLDRDEWEQTRATV